MKLARNRIVGLGLTVVLATTMSAAAGSTEEEPPYSLVEASPTVIMALHNNGSIFPTLPDELPDASLRLPSRWFDADGSPNSGRDQRFEFGCQSLPGSGVNRCDENRVVAGDGADDTIGREVVQGERDPLSLTRGGLEDQQVIAGG